jgi:glutaredoxin
MDKIAIIYTMKGCPYCVELKEMLDDSNIEYINRDIDEYNEEYDMFSEVVGNEYVPSLMLIENPEDSPKVHLYAPERDYNELEDAVKIIKEFYER